MLAPHVALCVQRQQDASEVRRPSEGIQKGVACPLTEVAVLLVVASDEISPCCSATTCFSEKMAASCSSRRPRSAMTVASRDAKRASSAAAAAARRSESMRIDSVSFRFDFDGLKLSSENVLIQV